MKNKLKTLLLSLLFLPMSCTGQSIEALIEGYSQEGGVSWEASSSTITFLQSGTIPFQQNGWDVPADVKKIYIKAGVTVTGRFDCTSNLVIEGENRQTSVLFGTDQTGYAKENGGGDQLSAIRVTAGNVTVKNLTSRNPKGFHFTSRIGSGLFEILDCDLLDTRGGGGNNSDGIVTWGGGRVHNCYIASGDDAIKVYGNITVEDTHIEMIQNTMPIQLGWGNYGSGATGVFKNLKITGNSGRFNSGRAILSARKGNYNKTILIDGLEVDNPNGSIFSFREGTGTFNITIQNARINVQNFQAQWNSGVKGTIKICDQVVNSHTTQNNWDCYTGQVTDTEDHSFSQPDIKLFPNPLTDQFQLEGIKLNHLFSVFDQNGRPVFSKFHDGSPVDFRQHPPGAYYLIIAGSPAIPFIKHQ